jgi:hypothetical protein
VWKEWIENASLNFMLRSHENGQYNYNYMQVLPSVSIVVVMDAKFPSLSIAGRL